MEKAVSARLDRGVELLVSRQKADGLGNLLSLEQVLEAEARHRLECVCADAPSGRLSVVLRAAIRSTR